MQHWQRLTPAPGFRVLASSRRSQAATMVLPAEERTGGPDNRHAGSDQWLYVLSGEGRAVVNDEAVPLGPGSVLLIEADEPHEIRNLGDADLEMLNIYAPPEY